MTVSSIVFTKKAPLTALVLSLTALAGCGGGGGGSDATPSTPVAKKDSTAPVITLVGDNPMTLADKVIFNEPGATALDDVDGAVAVTFSGIVGVSPDTYTLTYSASDEAGNKTSVERKVIVQGDITPAPFTFAPKNDVFLATEIVSDSITVSGINVEVPISVIGGEYSVDGGAYTAIAGKINDGQFVTLRATSSDKIATLINASLTIGSATENFKITTRSAEPSGLFEGTGSVNGETTNLVATQAIIHNEHFMLFDTLAALTGENVLYDGRILSYEGQTFFAEVDVYKDGLFTETVDASGVIENQVSFTVTLAGPTQNYGQGVLTFDTSRDAEYQKDATYPRLLNDESLWYGKTNTLNQDKNNKYRLRQFPETPTMLKGFVGDFNRCRLSGQLTIPEPTVNIYNIDFTVTENTLCDHVGEGYKGFVTVVDEGVDRIEDGTMWFAVANGIYSNFANLLFTSTR
ncbi:hypothetical protein CW745_12520 [Psychromonas sp. psych-6C06]|uniref:immunoglobulin-like domain-containing protein n=1 Tax=Psychromonas sp. psych-6C06 TaxID=2058089 RepID=UPI000C32DB36|nr:immunoglobulin-like domain-containing protein [Psychromonas sp. psych-6C06]PKF61121.1 hypothetical protein CW745_12520 [Psychromonas sp. psych-6C06]